MLRRILLTVGFAVLLSANAFGWQAGQIVGSVTDDKGAALPARRSKPPKSALALFATP